jgi:gamma-D-glutamyl-L-lysine dipeptidyl-peptidase
MVALFARGHLERIAALDAEVAEAGVADSLETCDRASDVVWGDDHHEVDHRLCGEARHCGRANVLDRDRELTDRGCGPVAQALECGRPPGVVGDHDDRISHAAERRLAPVRCAVEIAPVRREPADDAEQVTQALRGEPLRVEERRDGWARVVTAYDYPGWVRVEELEDGEGELPADASGSPVEVARSYLGVPYLWGGMTERGIDCSGLVHMAYRRLGRLVPRDADQQEDAGVEVEKLEPGDLVTYGEPVDHIAFWIGAGRILHSTGREDGIGVVEELEPEYLYKRRHKLIRL